MVTNSIKSLKIVHIKKKKEILKAKSQKQDSSSTTAKRPQVSKYWAPSMVGWHRRINGYVQFSSVAQSCPTLCNPMHCSTPGFPVHHQLPELIQTHVHWVSDAIQPSHPLSSPSPPAFNLSQNQGLLLWLSSSHQVAKVLELQLQHQSFQRIFRTDFLYNWLVWSPCSPRDSQESSPIPQFKSINSSALSFLYGPTLTSIHDHWKNHSFDQEDFCWQSNISVLNMLSRLVIAFLPRSKHLLISWLQSPSAVILDMSLSKLQEIEKDREAWSAAVHEAIKGQTWLSDWTTTVYVGDF